MSVLCNEAPIEVQSLFGIFYEAISPSVGEVWLVCNG